VQLGLEAQTQALADVKQTDTAARGISRTVMDPLQHFCSQSAAIVLHFDPDFVPGALHPDGNPAPFRFLAQTMADGVFHERLQNQVGNPQRTDVFDFKIELDPVLKARLADTGIGFDRLQLILQGDVLAESLEVERSAQIAGEV